VRKLITLICLILFSEGTAVAAGQDTIPNKKTCLPSTAHLQFAGFIGMLSGGFGYQYWHKRINSSLLYGYVPKEYASAPIHTVAIKTSVILLRISKPTVAIPVLYSGFTINCELSKHAFITLPDYYPTGYYSSQAVHLTFFAGAKAYISIKEKFAIAPYIEVGTLDSYLWYSLSHKTIDLDDIFKSAIGINLYLR
jgi:hypothetical protein